MNEQLNQLLRTLQTHPWLGHALGIVVLIILSNFLLGLQADNTQLYKQSAQLALQQARLQSVGERSLPPEQSQELRSRLSLLQGQMGVEPTPAIAQANIQDALNLFQRQLNLTNARIQVGSQAAVAGHPDFLEIKAQMDFAFSPDTLLPLLVALSKRTPPVFITDLNFQNQVNSRVSLSISTYYPAQKARQREH